MPRAICLRESWMRETRTSGLTRERAPNGPSLLYNSLGSERKYQRSGILGRPSSPQLRLTEKRHLSAPARSGRDVSEGSSLCLHGGIATPATTDPNSGGRGRARGRRRGKESRSRRARYRKKQNRHTA